MLWMDLSDIVRILNPPLDFLFIYYCKNDLFIPFQPYLGQVMRFLRFTSISKHLVCARTIAEAHNFTGKDVHDWKSCLTDLTSRKLFSRIFGSQKRVRIMYPCIFCKEKAVHLLADFAELLWFPSFKGQGGEAKLMVFQTFLCISVSRSLFCPFNYCVHIHFMIHLLEFQWSTCCAQCSPLLFKFSKKK